MRSKTRRIVLGAAVVSLMGVVSQYGCVSFGAEQFARTLDFCFLFDCQNGAFGGLIDPCPDQPLYNTTDDDTNDTGTTNNLFVDCPQTTDTTN